MTALTFVGRTRDAAWVLLEGTNLDAIITAASDNGEVLTVRADAPWPVSTGERILLDVLASLVGNGVVDLYDVAARLDESSRVAVVRALATLCAVQEVLV